VVVSARMPATRAPADDYDARDGHVFYGGHPVDADAGSFVSLSRHCARDVWATEPRASPGPAADRRSAGVDDDLPF
jgi:hypothetical protein